MPNPPPGTPQAGCTPAPALTPAEAGPTQWFTDQVQVHEPSLRNYLRGAFPTVRDVDDVVQESYLRVWRARAAQPITSVKAFLFRVARHLAVDTIRHESASPIKAVTDLAATSVLDEAPGVAENVSTKQEVELLIAAIDQLPSRCREIVILRKLRGLSQKEIAAQLGISEQTVQVQVARGVKKCEKLLRHRGLGGPTS